MHLQYLHQVSLTSSRAVERNNKMKLNLHPNSAIAILFLLDYQPSKSIISLDTQNVSSFRNISCTDTYL